MKTPWLVGVVVAVHVVAAGTFVLMQGCGRTMGPVSSPPPPVMPPRAATPVKPSLPPPVAPSQPAAREWPAQTTTYIVGKGDSLSVIAHKYNLSVSEIAALNNIKNANAIHAGQKLILPGKIALDKPVKTVTTAKPKPVAAASGQVHVVAKGESLSVIASKYGTSVSALKKVNGLTSDKIMVGQKLVMAEKSAGPSSAPAVPDATPTLTPALQLDSEPVHDGPPATPPALEPQPIGGTGRPSTAAGPAAAPVSPMATTPATTAPKPGAASPAYEVHVVEEGEDLYSVGLMWGVSTAKIKELNGLSDTELKPGQKLKIPMAD